MTGRTACIAAALACPSALAGGGLHGSWCGDALTLHLDATGIGMNEHTMCDASPLPADDAIYSAIIACKNVYPGAQKADGSFEVNEVPVDGPNMLTAMRVEGDRLAVLFEADGEAILLDRCDP